MQNVEDFDDLLQFALTKFGTIATLTDGTYKIALR